MGAFKPNTIAKRLQAARRALFVRRKAKCAGCAMAEAALLASLQRIKAPSFGAIRRSGTYMRAFGPNTFEADSVTLW